MQLFNFSIQQGIFYHYFYLGDTSPLKFRHKLKYLYLV